MRKQFKSFFRTVSSGAPLLKLTRSRKVSALLLVVITISTLQVAIYLMRPNTSNFVYAAASANEQATLGQVTLTSVVVSNQTMTLVSTFPTTVATTVSMTFATTVTFQPLQSPPDYTPAGIGIVAAAAIIALLIIFLKRKR